VSFLQTKDDVSLFYNDWGSGPPAVLIHGWPLNSDMWENTSLALAFRRLRMVA
jgi:non-heme chloroperoxidase